MNGRVITMQGSATAAGRSYASMLGAESRIELARRAAAHLGDAIAGLERTIATRTERPELDVERCRQEYDALLRVLAPREHP